MQTVTEGVSQAGLEELSAFRRRLSEALSRRGQRARIARATDLDPAAVTKIADGRTANPGILTVQAIEAALDQLENSNPDSERHTTEAGGEPGGGSFDPGSETGSESESASCAGAAPAEGAHSPSSAGRRAVGVRA